MLQETGNFRGKLFGGFDRQDVIDYIEEIAGERNSLQEENERLLQRLELFEERYGACPQDIPEDTAAGEDASDTDDRYADTRAELAALVSEAEDTLEDVLRRYDAVCADIKINVTQAQCELSKAEGHSRSLTGSLENAGERLREISRAIGKIKEELVSGEER